MQIRFNDPLRQFNSLKAELEKTVLDTMSSGWWLSGRRTEAFSAAFGKYLKTKHVLPVANGTDALELCLRAAGAGVDTEVITVANAGGYTSSACRAVGATPVYVDVEKNDLLMSIEEIPGMLSDRTIAVVSTHLYGNMVDVEKLRKTLKDMGREDIRIIEDCAQAHGASMNGRLAGSLGDMAAFSFYPTKNLGALGDAGAITTNSDELADKISRLSQYGWGEKYKVVEPFGRNSRIDEVQAAVLTVKLGRLDEWNSRRREILGQYSEALAPDSGYRIIRREGSSCVGHLAVMYCPDRQKATELLVSRGVDTAVHYPALDSDQPGWKDLPFRATELGNSLHAVEHILSVPCYPELRETEVIHICDALSDISARHAGVKT